MRKYLQIAVLCAATLIGGAAGLVLSSVLWHGGEQSRAATFDERFGTWIHRSEACGGGWFAAQYAPLFEQGNDCQGI